MPEKILIVDDEENITEFIARALRLHGFKTICAHDGDQALSTVEEELPDLIILDLMLPKMDGWEVCRRVKSSPATKKIPIIMLTARTSTEDVVQGLNLGADDYIKKPFPLDELLARVKVLLRRNIFDEERSLIENRDLKVHIPEREAYLRGNMLDLSPTEFDLLEILAGRLGHTVNREELLKKIWGMSGGDTRTVDVHISRLRKKLDDGRKPFLTAQTLRGRGYKLVWEDTDKCSPE